MALELKIEVLGEEIVSRRLLRFGERLQNAIPAWVGIVALLEAAERQQFDTEGAFSGDPWPPLAASTLASKKGGGGILVDSGRLRASLTGGGGDNVKEMTPQSLTWGTSVPYAKYHQTGTSRMPRRRPVQLPEPVKQAIVKELQAVLVEGGGRVGPL